MSKSVRILIVGNLAISRAGLRMLVESHDDFRVIGEARDRVEAVTVVTHERPDIVLLEAKLGYE